MTTRDLEAHTALGRQALIARQAPVSFASLLELLKGTPVVSGVSYRKMVAETTRTQGRAPIL